jgi:hypothetical protein
LFYYNPAEIGLVYQYSLIGVVIIPRRKSKKKIGVFIFLFWGTAENTLCQNANGYTNHFHSAFFVLQGQVF